MHTAEAAAAPAAAPTAGPAAPGTFWQFLSKCSDPSSSDSSSLFLTRQGESAALWGTHMQMEHFGPAEDYAIGDHACTVITVMSSQRF